MKSKTQYAYSTDGKESQNYTGIFNSLKETLQEAENDLGENLTEGTTIWIGKIDFPHLPKLDVNKILEYISYAYYNEFDEIAEDYLNDVKKEHKEELEEKLNTVLNEWLTKYNYEPDFYRVEQVNAYTYNGKSWDKL